MKALAIRYINRLRHATAYVPLQRLIIVFSIIIGILAGLAAVLLKNMVLVVSNFLTDGANVDSANILYFAYPFIGLLLTYFFVRFVLKGKKMQGITRILYSISKQDSNLKKEEIYSPLVASSLTVGSGGSVGLESPIVLSGSAIGSSIGQFFHLNYKTKTLLIGCGAAGATAGIFSAPVAAVLFALEILMIDLTTWSIIPLLISAVAGTAVSWLLLREGAVFSFTVMDPLVIENLPYYALLGMIAGLVSVYFVRGTKKIETWMEMLGKFSYRYDRRTHRFVMVPVANGDVGSARRLLIGGLILSTLVFIFPPLYGEGYEALNHILTGSSHELANSSFFYGVQESTWYLMAFLAMVMVFKVIAMAVTTGSGGVGGAFAPSLLMGGLTGYIISHLFNLIPFCNVSSKNFVLAGMAGLLSGVMHAPLTAIFLIVEITSGYGLFLPISLASAFSFIISKYMEPNTINTDRLARRGELITHNKDQAVLVLLHTNDLIEQDFAVMRAGQTLRDLAEVFPASSRNIYPVVDGGGMLRGVIYLDDIRALLFEPDRYDTLRVEEIMKPVAVAIEVNSRMERVMNLFEQTGAWNLPVVDRGRYIGFLSKSKIFSAYRHQLQDFYE